jgi:PAS domain S-box-containing protein
VNNAFTTITGFTPEDAIGKKPTEILFGKDPDKDLFIPVQERIFEGISFEGERPYVTKSGKPIWVWLQLQHIKNDEGKVKQHFAVLTDITEKKLAEEELKKLSMVAKETINGVVIRDKDQNVVWINNAFTKMYGYELDEIIGKNTKNFLPGAETDFGMVNYVKELYMKKDPFVYEMLNYSKAGNKKYVRVQVQPIFDEHGNIKQSFALHTDITRDKELEGKVELEKIIKQKEITDAVFAAQEKERSEIGREMHDNVNQLLGATRLYIDMAKTNEVDRNSLLTSASTFALDAIEEIRKLSKTLITPLIKEIGLADAIEDLIKEIMLVHPINILFTTNDYTEEKLSDKFQLNIFRVVQEQITNTLKHAQAKNIKIDFKENNDKFFIYISDDGIGFDTTIRKAGVGMTNIKSRCELYNGIVQLTSGVDVGTKLSLTFDIKDLVSNDHYD